MANPDNVESRMNLIPHDELNVRRDRMEAPCSKQGARL
jgi:hypothetical protein